MAEQYIYKGAPPERTFGPVPEGDYGYIVAECASPYWKNDKWILALKLIIEPSKAYVFANPWSGSTAAGEERDGIGDFLLSCNRAPRPGARPDWKAVVGARGRCRLKLETAQMGALAGKEVNKVAWFHRPHELGQPEQVQQTYNEPEVKKVAQATRAAAGGPVGPDLEQEPDDIPFNCDRG